MAALGAPARHDEESVGALVTRVGTDVQRIVRAETRLVQARVNAIAGVFRAASAGLAVALVCALAGLGALVAGIVLVVGLVLPLWAAALVVAGGFLVVAMVVTLVEIRVVRNGMREALASADEQRGVVSHGR